MSSPLPFLKEKPQTGIAVERRSDGSEPMKEDYGLTAACSELLHAIETKNSKGIAMALRNAFELLDSEPHEEGDHV